MGKAWDILHPRDLELGPLSRGEHGRRSRYLATLEALRAMMTASPWLVLDKGRIEREHASTRRCSPN